MGKKIPIDKMSLDELEEFRTKLDSYIVLVRKEERLKAGVPKDLEKISSKSGLTNWVRDFKNYFEITDKDFAAKLNIKLQSLRNKYVRDSFSFSDIEALSELAECEIIVVTVKKEKDSKQEYSDPNVAALS